ncbi:MAG: threonylcarbamoyl-AMP synthase [Deltaproteobacteria bacterium]|jgi:tRNA threonylcarbamoyl adenosine modification protein (Sua5/YciO/YrdC/YwlC family)|nr:threonylcarbamoyl-AMP synthase [Deltaproteobacteria bacterium]MBK8234370.1 threonylcarbamoyl-AMP synthase [Deltaproteobacteria bacterium]MBK8715095.1 threonylcarbamoyl-AMP synthase [Deltaproteobacteria bacterium]MBP7287112.1 threonylcarbamoyl-AMP synthase [Nannocystaceae bacterium]
MIVHIDVERPAPRILRPAVDALRDDGVIIYPTDTGYAFGCALSSSKGIASLRRLKGMNDKHPKPLTMLVRDLAELARYGHVGNQVFRTIRRLLPGPYTMVLRATSEVPRAMKNRNHEVGLRVPDHPVCRMLVDLLEEPLLTGSVTPAEQEPALEDPDDYERKFAREVGVVIDGGALWPDPSTVLRLVDDVIEVLREGKGPVPA